MKIKGRDDTKKAAKKSERKYTNAEVKQIKFRRKLIDQVSEKGKIFSVTFTKKDGSLRDMTARRKVVKHLKGGESNINHIDNLVSVYDMQAEGYRCINLLTLVKINGCGIKVVIEDNI